MKVAFRVDASDQLGTGHVMRCLVLADRLSSLGAVCHFIVREHRGHMIETIRRRGFQVRPLQSIQQDSPSTCRLVNPRPLQANWLGGDWQDDAAQTLRAMQSISPDLLVVDHYALDFRWEQRFRQYVDKILVIDDLADRRHVCDFLLDQNWFGENTSSRYQSLISNDCCAMLGPNYSLLRPEYALLRGLMPPRDGEVKRLLVFMGGTDPTNETEKVLQALRAEHFEHLVVDIVIGASHPDAEGIERQVNTRPLTRLHRDLPTLAGWMVRADLMIGAGGVTTWERMCLGLPAIVITVANNQVQMNQALKEENCVFLLGSKENTTKEQIAEAIYFCLNSPRKLRAMSLKAQTLVLGTGVNEVCKLLGAEGK